MLIEAGSLSIGLGRRAGLSLRCGPRLACGLLLDDLLSRPELETACAGIAGQAAGAGVRIWTTANCKSATCFSAAAARSCNWSFNARRLFWTSAMARVNWSTWSPGAATRAPSTTRTSTHRAHQVAGYGQRFADQTGRGVGGCDQFRQCSLQILLDRSDVGGRFRAHEPLFHLSSRRAGERLLQPIQRGLSSDEALVRWAPGRLVNFGRPETFGRLELLSRQAESSPFDLGTIWSGTENCKYRCCN